MADRPVAEAVADLRFSDAKVGSDLATARATLMRALQQVERDAKVTVGVNADFTQIRTQLARELGQMEADGGIIIPVKLAVDDAIDELAALEAIAETTSVVMPVTVDTDAAVDDLAAVEALIGDIDPVRVPVDVDGDPALRSIGPLADQFSQEAVPQFAMVGQQAGAEFGWSFERTAKRTFTGLSIALGSMLSLSLVRGFQRLTTIEDSLASLTVALDDAGRAAQVLDDVVETVTGTPFNLDQFAKAASQMISFGIEAEKVPGFLTAIGEAAASQGSRANEFAQRLSTTFGRISAANRITNFEIQQFSAVGVNALAILGNAFDVTASQAREMVARGAIPAAEALDILAQGIMEGSDGIAGTTIAFAGTMENLRNTLVGAIGGFKAATARFGANIIDPISETLTVGFNAASGAIDAFGRTIREVLGGIAESEGVARFQDLLRTLPELASGAIDKLQEFGPALAPIAAAFGAAGLGSISRFLGPLGALVPQISPVVAAVGALIATTPEIRSALIPALVDVGETIAQVGGVLGVAAGEIMEAFLPAIISVAEGLAGLTPLITTIGDVVSVLVRGLAPALKLVGDGLALIPPELLTAIAAGFLGFKAATIAAKALDALQLSMVSLGGAIGKLPETLSRSNPFGTFVQDMDEAGNAVGRMDRVMASAAPAIIGGLSGIAMQSDNTGVALAGVVGAIGSVAQGFAVGGPWGAAIAGAGVVLGGIAGHFLNARREAEEFSRQAAGLAERLLTEFEQLEGSNPIQAIADELALLRSEVFAKGFLDEFVSDDDLAKLDQLGISFAEVIALANDSTDPVAAFGEAYRDLANDVLGLVDIVDGDLIGTIRQLAIDPESFGFDQLTFQQEAQIRRFNIAANELEQMADRLGVDISLFDGLAANFVQGVIGLYRDAAEVTAREGEALLRRLEAEAALAAEALLERINLTRGALVDLANLAGQAGGVDAIGSLIVGLVDSQDEAQILAEILGITIPDNLYDAANAARDVETAIVDNQIASLNWADALRQVAEEMAGVGRAASFIASAQSLTAIGGSILDAANREVRVGGGGGGGGGGRSGGGGGGRSVADRAEQIQQQIERVDELMQRLDQVRVDAAENERILEVRILEAEAAGALEGAAGLRRELERVYEPVEAAEERLEQALERLQQLESGSGGSGGRAGSAAGRSAGSGFVTSFVEQVESQATVAGMTLLEFITQTIAPTPEAMSAFQDLINAPIQKFLRETPNLFELSPEAAMEVVTLARDEMLEAWSTVFGPEQAAEVASRFFDVDPAILRVRTAYLATSILGGLEAIAAANDVEFEVTADTTSFEDLTQAAIDFLVENGVTIPADADMEEVWAKIQEIERRNLRLTADLDVRPVFRGGNMGALGGMFAIADGGVLRYYREGGVEPPHIAAMVPAGSWRVMAEPETGGEAYIPLAPSKRGRSTEILNHVADLFGLSVMPREQADAIDSVLARLNRGDVDMLARAIAQAMRPAGGGLPDASTRLAQAQGYDRGVHVGQITVNGSDGAMRTAKRIVADLSKLAMRR